MRRLAGTSSGAAGCTNQPDRTPSYLLVFPGGAPIGAEVKAELNPGELGQTRLFGLDCQARHEVNADGKALGTEMR